MDNSIEPNADLDKILATLASLQQSGSTPVQNYEQTFDHRQSYEGYPDAAQGGPLQQNFSYHGSADPRLPRRPAVQHGSVPRKAQERASTPLIDPATITEWKQGLRCVSKIASQNPDFASSIRKLMKEQEGNVKQWDAGRTRLIEDQKIKRENEETHRAALSLPGLLENSPLLRTPEREQEELSEYDSKVYRACKAMFESQLSSLKVLGVPFFGVKPYLVLYDTEEQPSADDNERQPNTTNGPKITKTQLLELQRKMLTHLVELYGD